jgi:hypothetical protein
MVQVHFVYQYVTTFKGIPATTVHLPDKPSLVLGSKQLLPDDERIKMGK